jgi:hypothetical protein
MISAAPRIGPAMPPIPPSTTMARIVTDPNARLNSENVSGEMNEICAA